MGLTVGDVSVKKMPDGKLKGIVEVSPRTKTGKRTVIMNGHWVNSVKSHLRKGIKLRNAEIEEHNSLVATGEIKKFRWRFQGQSSLYLGFNDTPLFLNPLNHVINKEDKRDLRRLEQEGHLDDALGGVRLFF